MNRLYPFFSSYIISSGKIGMRIVMAAYHQLDMFWQMAKKRTKKQNKTNQS